MKWQFEDKIAQGKFSISVDDPFIKGEGLLNGKKEMINTIVYNPGNDQKVVIDHITYGLPQGSLLPLVANQTFSFEQPQNLVAWQFNRDFYCIVDHEAEVGCVGFLFYGIQHPLFIRLSADEQRCVSLIKTQCIEDMQIKDKMQGEMLRTLLKRLIINITRIAKQQTDAYRLYAADKMDLVRKFNLLLEVNFRHQHEVQFYAQALHKSPKTLTNFFALCKYPSPSELIRRRITLEAKRYLYFTDKSAKEVADDLGFANAAHFSRFFKTATGSNFSVFKTPVSA
jgi:AraC family transcriptional regulator, transcriptional activator of pobA